MKERWGVLLDRDGTLVVNAHHPVRPEQLVPYPGMAAALARLAAAGARLAVVSNQSAVARGLLDDAGLRRLDRRLRELVGAGGARLAGTWYCPHHPDFGPRCDCRKPEPGLLRRALDELGVSPDRAWMVGDSLSDLEAAARLGVPGILVLTGYGRRHREEVLRRGLARHVVRDIRGAAARILAARDVG